MTTTAAAEVDHLEYVRQYLASATAANMTRIAADTIVSLRTVYNVRDKKHEPNYTTVVKLYDAIRKIELAAEDGPK